MYSAGQGTLLCRIEHAAQAHNLNFELRLQEMAIDSFGLFIHQSQATEGKLQTKIYQIVFDILMLYGISFLEVKGREVSQFYT